MLEASLQRFFDVSLGPAWRDLQEMRALMQAAVRGQIKRPSEVATPQLMACVSYYEQQIPQNQRDKVIDSQIRVFRHNREHYQKITANLLPILSMLTSGDLGGSLSPDPFDLADRRPIMNFEKIERGGHVLYMCLDSLPDPSVASAIGALAIADLAARAGMRYNLGITRRITLVVDEIANVINQPLIEILNKGAEGGIHSICAMQRGQSSLVAEARRWWHWRRRSTDRGRPDDGARVAAGGDLFGRPILHGSGAGSPLAGHLQVEAASAHQRPLRWHSRCMDRQCADRPVGTSDQVADSNGGVHGQSQ